MARSDLWPRIIIVSAGIMDAYINSDLHFSLDYLAFTSTTTPLSDCSNRPLANQFQVGCHDIPVCTHEILVTIAFHAAGMLIILGAYNWSSDGTGSQQMQLMNLFSCISSLMGISKVTIAVQRLIKRLIQSDPYCICLSHLPYRGQLDSLRRAVASPVTSSYPAQLSLSSFHIRSTIWKTAVTVPSSLSLMSSP